VRLALDSRHVHGLRASFRLLYLEAYPVAVNEALEPGHSDRGIMNEEVSPFILFDEAVSPLLVKPFYGSFWQINSLLSQYFNRE
jgi:hypothetical protein